MPLNAPPTEEIYAEFHSKESLSRSVSGINLAAAFLCSCSSFKGAVTALFYVLSSGLTIFLPSIRKCTLYFVSLKLVIFHSHISELLNLVSRVDKSEIVFQLLPTICGTANSNKQMGLTSDDNLLLDPVIRFSASLVFFFFVILHLTEGH